MQSKRKESTETQRNVALRDRSLITGRGWGLQNGREGKKQVLTPQKKLGGGVDGESFEVSE